MSRFTDQQCLTVDGVNMTVKTRPGLDLAAVAALPRLMGEAKDMLQKAIIAVDARPVKVWTVAMANRYFLTDLRSGPKDKELALIKRVLSSTLAGLSSDITLKVGAVVSRSEKASVLGSVRTIDGAVATKPHHTVVTEMGPTKHFWQKAPTQVAHAIKLRDTALLGDLGLVTLIHEATHKYAGTIDYCYFDRPGEKPTDKFTNKEKALANADSHAYFAVKVGSHG